MRFLPVFRRAPRHECRGQRPESRCAAWRARFACNHLSAACLLRAHSGQCGHAASVVRGAAHPAPVLLLASHPHLTASCGCCVQELRRTRIDAGSFKNPLFCPTVPAKVHPAAASNLSPCARASDNGRVSGFGQDCERYYVISAQIYYPCVQNEYTYKALDGGRIIEVRAFKCDPGEATSCTPMPSPPFPPMLPPSPPEPPPPPPAPQHDRDKLVSTPQAAETIDEFTKLGNKLYEDVRELPIGNGAVTLEELTRELVRPMLKEWLDQHLPITVERLVREEIERLVMQSQRKDPW